MGSGKTESIFKEIDKYYGVVDVCLIISTRHSYRRNLQTRFAGTFTHPKIVVVQLDALTKFVKERRLDPRSCLVVLDEFEAILQRLAFVGDAVLSVILSNLLVFARHVIVADGMLSGDAARFLQELSPSTLIQNYFKPFLGNIVVVAGIEALGPFLETSQGRFVGIVDSL